LWYNNLIDKTREKDGRCSRTYRLTD